MVNSSLHNNLHPLIFCRYKQLDFQIIMDELTDIATSQMVPDTDELLRYENINRLTNIVRSKLTRIVISKVELLSSARLSKFNYLFSCPLVFQQKIYGKIVAATKKSLELISYYLSETDSLKLPLAELPALNIQVRADDQQLTISSWHEVTLIERQSYVSCNLTSPKFSCNIYSSPELILNLGKIANIAEFNADANPAMEKFVILLNQAFSLRLTPVAPWRLRFNHLGGYLKILLSLNGVNGYILLDNWTYLSQQLTQNTSKEPQPYNSLFNLPLAFPLVHGEAELTFNELTELKPGDVVIFDSQLAPDHVVIDFSGLSYKFKLISNQLIFCDVIS